MEDYFKNVLSKNIYIVDNEKMYYFEDLREELIKEIKGDLLENVNDKDIVKNDLELLEKVLNIKYGYDEKFIINELQLFGVHIVKINDVLSNLEDLKAYFKFNSISEENELIDKIEDLEKEIKNYFND